MSLKKIICLTIVLTLLITLVSLLYTFERELYDILAACMTISMLTYASVRITRWLMGTTTSKGDSEYEQY